MNKLYFGDNLEIMREMPSDSVDLICTDPPFNSGRTYNIFLGDSLAQKKAFGDIWVWDDAAEETRMDIDSIRKGKSDQYRALSDTLKGLDFILADGINGPAVKGNKGAMRSYLNFMGPRLVEMHRLLKKTGSIYLHCDPTASHYLKIIMDVIWDTKNHRKNDYFRNEIVWHYSAGRSPNTDFKKKHDIILRYVKGKNFEFNQPYMPYLEKDRFRFTFTDDKGRLYRINYEKDNDGQYKKFYWDTGTPVDSVWTYLRGKELNQIGSTSKERLGYPTQKPRELYERMIKASSNEGDIIMDPFAGCGTSIDAAHTLKRNWIGIDLTILALDPMSKRLKDRHGLVNYKDYETEGYPTNMQEVKKLVKNEKRYNDFANWAVTRLGLKPTQNVRDGGKDGVGQIEIWDPKIMKSISKRMLSEVKAKKKPTLNDVRSFCHVMNKEDAILGIFITIESISKNMKQEAQSMGTFEHNGVNYPRLQFWQVDDNYFNNTEIINQIIKLPREWIKDPIPKSDRHFEDQQGVFDWNEEVKDPIDPRNLSVKEMETMLANEQLSELLQIVKESNLDEKEMDEFWEKLRQAGD